MRDADIEHERNVVIEGGGSFQVCYLKAGGNQTRAPEEEAADDERDDDHAPRRRFGLRRGRADVTDCGLSGRHCGGWAAVP